MQKYRPSNGTEGQGFMEYFCDRCIQDDGETKLCEIIGKTMAFNVDEPGYPEEWQYGEDGRPLCTAFKHEA